MRYSDEIFLALIEGERNVCSFIFTSGSLTEVISWLPYNMSLC